MDPVLYRLLRQIAVNKSLTLPAASEPWGSSAWVFFLQRLAKATAP